MDSTGFIVTLTNGLGFLLAFIVELAALAIAVLVVRPNRPDAWLWLAVPAALRPLLSVVGAGFTWLMSSVLYDLVDYTVATPVLALSGLLLGALDAALVGAFLAGVVKLARPPRPE